MKKLISILSLFAILLSLAACGAEEAPQATAETPSAESTETTEPVVEQIPGQQVLTPEQLYGHINQLEPIGGVYKIWSEVGVQNMADHPEANFELLCNVDMQGATVRPIGTDDKPFTGELKGGNFGISNFTVQGGEEENFGFIGINKGTVRNFLIQNVTFLPGEKAKNIGTITGDNQGQLIRCTVSGTMNVENCAAGGNCGGVIGINSGNLANTVATVDLNVTAANAVNVGGIVGLSTAGSYEYTDTNGKLDVTGEGKSVGLLAGTCTDTVFTGCAFVGATNTVNGELFINFTGNADDDELTVAAKCLRRDNDREPLPENVQRVRQLAVDHMYAMGTIEWHVKEELVHSCKCGTTSTCEGTWMPGWTYYGLPYKHGNGSLLSMQYCIGDDGYFDDWMYDLPNRNGYDSYIGAMCSSASQMAWWRVSNSVDHMVCVYTLPGFEEFGCVPVGTGWYENAKLNDRYDTAGYIDSCTEQVFFEALAMAHPGDCVVNGLDVGDHIRMVAHEPVVVRDQQGNIDANKSYLITHECSGTRRDEIAKTQTNWKINEKYTFGALRGDGYVPVTCEEMLTGEMEPAECTILDGADGKLGMTIGMVKGNYFLEAVTMVITDSEGNEVMNKIMFPKAGKFNRGNTRATSLAYIDYFDLAQFAVALQDVSFKPGETYTYTISAHLACDEDFVLKTDSFVQGGAQ